VVTPSGWFAARSSGTKDVYKLYAEGFKAQAVIRKAFEDERISQ
jgi:phosphoglucomutase